MGVKETNALRECYRALSRLLFRVAPKVPDLGACRDVATPMACYDQDKMGEWQRAWCWIAMATHKVLLDELFVFLGSPFLFMGEACYGWNWYPRQDTGIWAPIQ